MDGLMLLRRARDAGLAVTAEGDKLVIRGPKRAEPVALLLIEHKRKVLAALVPAERAAQRWRDAYSARISHWFLRGRRMARCRGTGLCRTALRMASPSWPAVATIAVCRMWRADRRSPGTYSHRWKPSALREYRLRASVWR